MKRKHLLLILLLIVSVAVGFFLYDYVTLKVNLNDPEYLNDLQGKHNSTTSRSILEKLSVIMVLPDESNPTIATIKDLNKLKASNPEFYKNAQNNDSLILYSTIAIIYRPEENKIISVAPVVANE